MGITNIKILLAILAVLTGIGAAITSMKGDIDKEVAIQQKATKQHEYDKNAKETHAPNELLF